MPKVDEDNDIVDLLLSAGNEKASKQFIRLIKATSKYAKGHHGLCRTFVYSDQEKRHCTCGYDELTSILAGIVNSLDRNRRKIS